MEICGLNNQNTSINGGTNDKMVSILVVDDDRTCLSIVASLFKECNYQVLTAKDPFDALFILRTRAIKFDLVVSDVHMPELDGFELQRRIHKEFQLPVVLMSADKNATNLCDGASFFVLKPITTKDLKSIWNFGNQWKKKLAKGKIKISDDGYDNDTKDDRNSKRKLRITDDDDHDDSKNIAMKGKALAKPKKNKVVWTPFLHGKFVQALQRLGPDSSVPRNILHVMNVPALTREHVASHLQKFKDYQKKWSEAEHDPNMIYNPKTGKMWSSSFLSHEALLGYRQSKLLTNPGFPGAPSGLTSGTYSSQMYQPEAPKFPSSDEIFSGFTHVQPLAPVHLYDNGFSTQIQPTNCYTGSEKNMYPTYVSQSNFASPTLDNHVPEQQYEPADLSNVFLYGKTYQSTDENKNQDYYVGSNFGDALLVNEDMPNADNAHTNLNEQKNGEEVNWASWGSNNTTKVEDLVFWDGKNTSEQKNGEANGASSGSNTTTNVEELVFWDGENPSEKQDNGGIVNSTDNTGTSNVESQGNQPSNDQQGIGEAFWKYLFSDFDGGDNQF